MLGRNQTREQNYSALADDEIMEATAEAAPPHLEDAQPAALRTILQRIMLKPDDAMDETVQIEIVGLIGKVVQKQPGAALLG